MIEYKAASVGFMWSMQSLRDAGERTHQRAPTPRLALKSDILRFQSVVGDDHAHNPEKGRSRFLRRPQPIIKKQA